MLLMEHIAGSDQGLNLRRLGAFVDAAVARSTSLPPPAARTLLRSNAELVRRHLRMLSGWAADGSGAPCPPHLRGLSAFDLADAAEALEQEAVRRRA